MSSGTCVELVASSKSMRSSPLTFNSILKCYTQFRMHDSTTVKLLLSVSSHPIMEDSQDIEIGPYHEQLELSNDNASEVGSDNVE